MESGGPSERYAFAAGRTSHFRGPPPAPFAFSHNHWDFLVLSHDAILRGADVDQVHSRLPG